MTWKNQQEAALANAKQLLKQKQNSKELLKFMLSKQKLIKMEKNIQKLEQNVVILGNQQDYTFDILLTSWMLSPFSDHHKDMKTIIVLGSLIPPSTAEVEQSFRLMKLICAGVRNRLLTENLSHCMRICKFRDLTADEYEQILRLSLKADETKNKKRKVSSPLQLKILHIYVSFFLSPMFLFFNKLMFEEKKVPTVTTHNALHGDYNFFFFPLNPFLQ